MNRASWRIVVSHALASVGMSLPWPLLLWVVWEQTHDEWLLGVAGAARMLPYLLFSWAAGLLADRFRRDVVVRLTLHARLVLLLAMAVAVPLGWTAASVLLAAASVAVATPAYPALAAAMPAAAGAEHRRATDLLVTVEVASFVVGPAVGGLLLAPALRDLVPAVAVTSVLLGLVAFSGVVLPDPRGVDRDEPTPGMLHVIRTSAPVRRALGAAAATNGVLSVLAMNLLPLAELAWQRGGAAYGLATSMLGFGALAGPLLAGLGVTDTARVRIGFWLMAGGVLAVAPTSGPMAALLPLVLVSAASVQIESAATGLLQEHAPNEVRAGILGLGDAVMVGAAMVGSLLTPVLADWWGPELLLLPLAVVTALCVGLGHPARTPARHRAPRQRPVLARG